MITLKKQLQKICIILIAPTSIAIETPIYTYLEHENFFIQGPSAFDRTMAQSKDFCMESSLCNYYFTYAKMALLTGNILYSILHWKKSDYQPASHVILGLGVLGLMQKIKDDCFFSQNYYYTISTGQKKYNYHLDSYFWPGPSSGSVVYYKNSPRYFFWYVFGGYCSHLRTTIFDLKNGKEYIFPNVKADHTAIYQNRVLIDSFHIFNYDDFTLLCSLTKDDYQKNTITFYPLVEKEGQLINSLHAKDHVQFKDVDRVYYAPSYPYFAIKLKEYSEYIIFEGKTLTVTPHELRNKSMLNDFDSNSLFEEYDFLNNLYNYNRSITRDTINLFSAKTRQKIVHSFLGAQRAKSPFSGLMLNL